jgi:hypothetical protein
MDLLEKTSESTYYDSFAIYKGFVMWLIIPSLNNPTRKQPSDYNASHYQ